MNARIRTSIQVDSEVMEAVRDCVTWFTGPPRHLTINEFAATAFVREIERLAAAAKLPPGTQFPSRGGFSLRGNQGQRR